MVSGDDNFDYQDRGERYRPGTLETEANAVAAVRALVDGFVAAQYTPCARLEIWRTGVYAAGSRSPPGMSAAELYAFYTGFGADPFSSGRPFSAWSYATLCRAHPSAGRR